MAARVAAFDWSKSDLGPRSGWPPSLKTAVDIILGSPVPMVVLWGRNGIMIYNAGYAAIAGERHPQLLGQKAAEAWPEAADWNRHVLDVVLAGGTLTYKEQPFALRRGGEVENVWFNLDYSPVPDEHGQPAGVLAVVVETTEGVRGQQALAESDARFRNLADHAPVMVWLTGPDGACVYLSRSWYELTGQTPETGLGFGWLDAVHPDDAERVRGLFLAAHAQGEPYNGEYRVRRHDGAYRWALDAATPRRGPDGRLLGYIGSVIDITERKDSEQQQNLLMREIDHRAKNVLAVVQAVLRLSRADTAEGYREVVEGRIASLARAHSLLASNRWNGVELRHLLEEELAPYVAGQEQRLNLTGPSLLMSAELAQTLALVLHELATNAAKHGALSNSSGTIVISWQATAELALSLEWRETTGRKVRAPKRLGFGSELIRSSIRRQLGGEITKEWPATGMICHLTIPAQPSIAPRAAPEVTADARLKVMLVEDDALIAMEMEDRLAGFGCQVIGTAASIATARELAATHKPEFALLDANLNGDSSVPLAVDLVQSGVQIAFCTGYEDIQGLPDALRSCPKLTKPVADEDLRRVLSAATEARF
jgi:PAS domain S-box-containing protein